MMFDEQGNEGFDSDGNNAWDTSFSGNTSSGSGNTSSAGVQGHTAISSSYDWSNSNTYYNIGSFESSGAYTTYTEDGDGNPTGTYKFPCFDFPTYAIGRFQSAELRMYQFDGTNYSGNEGVDGAEESWVSEDVTRTINGVSVPYTRFTWWGYDATAGATQTTRAPQNNGVGSPIGSRGNGFNLYVRV